MGAINSIVANGPQTEPAAGTAWVAREREKPLPFEAVMAVGLRFARGLRRKHVALLGDACSQRVGGAQAAAWSTTGKIDDPSGRRALGWAPLTRTNSTPLHLPSPKRLFEAAQRRSQRVALRVCSRPRKHVRALWPLTRATGPVVRLASDRPLKE